MLDKNYFRLNFKRCIILFTFIIATLPSCKEDEKTYSVISCKDNPIPNKHNIEGYSCKVSYSIGELINIKVHCPNNTFDIKIYKLGLENKLVFEADSITGKVQNYTDCSYQYGCNWETSYSLVIPNDWFSGMYSAKLSDDSGNFYVTFIITPKDNTKEIALLASTNTWQAYNNWGGASFYKYDFENNPKNLSHCNMVSYERPNPRGYPFGDQGHCANAEQHILKWLYKNKYEFDVYSDIDLHKNNVLSGYKAVIISTHSEYWTEKMYNNLLTFLNSGGNLLYLSGNGIYWKVTLRDKQMELQKNGNLHIHNSEKGGLWRELGRSESKVLGVRYSISGYRTYAGYKVINADHWIFDNTNIENGDTIGVDGLNYGGASGWETDKTGGDSPSNIILLAKGTNPDNGGAEMTYYDHTGGGGVFSVGSITFGGSLAIDDNLSQITKNVLNKYID